MADDLQFVPENDRKLIVKRLLSDFSKFNCENIIFSLRGISKYLQSQQIIKLIDLIIHKCSFVTYRDQSPIYNADVRRFLINEYNSIDSSEQTRFKNHVNKHIEIDEKKYGPSTTADFLKSLKL